MSVAQVAVPDPTVPLRAPDVVMRLDRLGTMHPTRLSFARAMLRRVEQEGWRVGRAVWELDPDGFGHAVYRVDTPTRVYSLVAFSQALPPEARTDRVIAEAWDATFVLYDGLPDPAGIARLAVEVPLQEAGRFAETELVLSRANKSVRLFETVVAALAAGRQPETAELGDVGYLMRTTAVYGNGKFGIADRSVLADRPEFAGPFRAEMLTVWLIRGFTVDLAEHCAAARDAAALRLAPALRRRLGVGNSTGLGMAPFLVRHPMLIDSWMNARETALSRVRSLPDVDACAWAAFTALLHAAVDDVAGWTTGDATQRERIRELEADLAALAADVDAGAFDGASWDDLFRWCEAHLGAEAQDYIIGLMIEPHGDLVDDLADRMGADEPSAAAIDGTVDCESLLRTIERTHGWALDADYARPDAQARFWYVSAEKLEPRLGEREFEDGAAREQPLAFARDVAALRAMLREAEGQTLVAQFLLDHPGQRHVVRRVQIAARFPYAEIRGNLIDAAMRPIDLLRCKLAFFGASRFDPRSDRWLRIAMFRGAPYPDEIASSRGEGVPAC